MYIKALNCINDILYITLEDGSIVVEIDIERITKLIQIGMKFFKSYPDGILKVSDEIDSFGYYNSNHIKIEYNTSTNLIKQIKINDKALVFNTDCLSEYFNYAKSHNFLDGFNKFLEKLSKNPHRESMQDLLEFLSKNNLPLNNDGDILAFKALNCNADKEYVDYHTGLVKQKVNDRVSMPRSLVEFNKEQTCSFGLHVADFSYANDFYRGNGDLFLVKIHVKDVVSVPMDTNSKIRVKSYDLLYKFTDEERNLLKNGKIPNSINKFIVNCDYKPKRIIRLKANCVYNEDQIKIYDLNKSNKKYKAQKGKTQKNKSNINLDLDVVKPIHHQIKEANNDYLLNLNKVLNIVKKYKENKTMANNDAKFVIDFYKKYKEKLTWLDLNIDDKLRKRIYRIAKMY